MKYWGWRGGISDGSLPNEKHGKQDGKYVIMGGATFVAF